jgi:hypothetical protein
METRNKTLSLPKDFLKKVKLPAVRRQTSISGLLTRELEKIITQEEAYESVKRRSLRLLEKGFDYNTGGVR